MPYYQFRVSNKILQSQDGHEWVGKIIAFKGHMLTCVDPLKAENGGYETDLTRIVQRIHHSTGPLLANLQQVQNLRHVLEKVNAYIAEHNALYLTKILDFFAKLVAGEYSRVRIEEIDLRRADFNQINPDLISTQLEIAERTYGVARFTTLPRTSISSCLQSGALPDGSPIRWYLDGAVPIDTSFDALFSLYAVLAPISSLLNDHAAALDGSCVTTTTSNIAPASILLVPIMDQHQSTIRQAGYHTSDAILATLYLEDAIRDELEDSSDSKQSSYRASIESSLHLVRILSEKIRDVNTLLDHSKVSTVRLYDALNLLNECHLLLKDMQIAEVEAVRHRGKALEDLRNAEEALLRVTSALELDPLGLTQENRHLLTTYAEVHCYEGSLNEAIQRILDLKRACRISPPALEAAEGIATVDGVSYPSQSLLRTLERAIQAKSFQSGGLLYAICRARREFEPPASAPRTKTILMNTNEVLAEFDSQCNEQVKGFVFEFWKNGQRRGVLMGSCHRVPASFLQFRTAIREGLARADVLLCERTDDCGGPLRSLLSHIHWTAEDGIEWGSLDGTLIQMALDCNKRVIGVENGTQLGAMFKDEWLRVKAQRPEALAEREKPVMDDSWASMFEQLGAHVKPTVPPRLCLGDGKVEDVSFDDEAEQPSAFLLSPTEPARDDPAPLGPDPSWASVLKRLRQSKAQPDPSVSEWQAEWEKKMPSIQRKLAQLYATGDRLAIHEETGIDSGTEAILSEILPEYRAQFLKEILTDRNAIHAEVLLDQLNNYPGRQVFAMFGAGHLLNSPLTGVGVKERLERAGFDVRPV